jgi:subtilisin family serine protease
MKRAFASLVSLGLGCSMAVACASSDRDGERVAVRSAAARTMDARVTSALAGGGPVSVMVYLKSAARLDASAALTTKEAKGAFVFSSLVRHAGVAQAGLVALLGAAHQDFQAFHVVNAIAVRNAAPALVQAIAARPDVARVTRDRDAPLAVLPKRPAPARSEGTPAADRGTIEPNIVATGADRVWSTLSVTGKGVVVAGQDTGVEWAHPALKGHYRGWDGTTADHRFSWHDAVHQNPSNSCGSDLGAPCDDFGHGSHTMGTMVGDDGAQNRVGMAPDAKWIACRNMDGGVGKPSTYIECFEWLLAPYPQGGDPRKDGDPKMAPDVVNNSWGCNSSEGCSGSEIVPAIHALEAAGVVVVASAGNDGPGCGTITDQPASDSADTITVGAYDHRTGDIAGFSSRGPSALDGQPGPQVAAPGVGIRSSVPGDVFVGGWDGTSMAGPHVVGAIALLLSADPTLRGNPAAVMDIVRRTAKPKMTGESCGGLSGAAVPNNTFGHGLLDAFSAVSGRVR